MFFLFLLFTRRLFVFVKRREKKEYKVFECKKGKGKKKERNRCKGKERE